MYTAQETRQLILNLLKEKGSNSNKMLIEIGCNQSLIFDMGKKNAMPSGDKLAKIADYLCVSVDYLLGRTDNPEINK